MIKVIVVSEEGRGGGPLKRMKLLGSHWSGKINYSLLLPKSTDPLILESLQNEKIKLDLLSLHPLTKNIIGLLRYVLFFIPEIIRLIRFFRKEKPDIIHANGSWQIKSLIASKFTKSRAIWHMNDMYQPKLVRVLFKICAGLPDAYIFASERTKKYYMGIAPAIKHYMVRDVIPAPVKMEMNTVASQALNKPTKVVTVCYINENKGLEELLEALSLLKEEEISLDIVGPVIAGKESYMRKLKGLMADLGLNNVRFCGYKQINASFLKQYDFYICSSRREASPMAVWEALAAGLPVISTDVGDVASVLEEYECGILIREGTTDSISEAIRHSIGLNENRYFHMREKARRAAQEMFAIENLIPKYVDCYTKVASGTFN